jgi:beta-N-acetylhexosaminidase
MDWQAALDRMSLREKVGQLVLCGFQGTELNDDLKRLITEYRISGVILFSRNVESVGQVSRLNQSIQDLSRQTGGIPMWISIDQEGGMVARLTEGVSLMPGNMAMGAAGDAASVQLAAGISGLELWTLGVNMNYAPVLDVNNCADNPVIGVRSYGECPGKVAELGSAAIRGYQAAGVAAVAKHFPGHGDTHVDSHLDLPVIPHDRDRLDRVELLPFHKAIGEGVDAIMTAHIHFPRIEPDRLPTTLSRKVLTGLLRGELGFDGVITTDCMEMNAISVHYGTVEASVMAIEAGADLVLVSHRMDLQIAAVAAIEEAARSGRIPMEQIDASVGRILRLKAKRGIWGGVEPAPADLAMVGSDAHLDTARRISEASLTLVRNEQAVLPLRSERTLAITVLAAAQTQADDEISHAGGLGAALKALGLDCSDRSISINDVAGCIPELLEMAGAADVKQLVIGVYDASFHQDQIALVRGLQGAGKPLVVVALRSPYDLLHLGDVQGYVAVYENRPLSIRSTAKALLGRIPFRGKLPVTLTESYPAGWGLTTE